MSQFYVVRLQEANSTIAHLQDEANRLREGVKLQALRLQEELQQTRLDLASKAADNQDLPHRIKMQHTNGYGMQGMMQGPMFVQSNTHQNALTWEVNTSRSIPHTH
jgi:hypothetical protein